MLLCVCRYHKLFSICQRLLGDCEIKALQGQFLQWLASTAKPDLTYNIVESLLSMTPDQAHTADKQFEHSPWQDPNLPVVGSMKVIRVTGVRTAGRHFHGIIVKFLKQTAREDSQGPQWSGFIEPASASAVRSHAHRQEWQLFSVIKDFGQNEPTKNLSVPQPVLHRSVSSKHPAYKQV